MSAAFFALLALTIDSILPALGQIAADFALSNANDQQFIVSAVFAGLLLGHIVFGPLSDSVGRKNTVFIGMAVFLAGGLPAMYAEHYAWFLTGRLLQGLGLAAGRITLVAMARDQFSGRRLARVMSFIMSVFILAPILGPAIGQLLLLVMPWRMIFAVIAVLALMVTAWFAIRQPETLDKAARVPFDTAQLAHTVRAILAVRTLRLYMYANGFAFAVLLTYLSTLPQILEELYDATAHFALFFAMISAGSMVASIANGLLVERFGMRRLSHLALWAMLTVALAMLAVAYLGDGVMPLALFIAGCFGMMLFIGVLFSNFNALAMEAVSTHIGMAATIIGAGSMVVGMPIALMLGQLHGATLYSLILGFISLAVAMLVIMRADKRQRQ